MRRLLSRCLLAGMLAGAVVAIPAIAATPDPIEIVKRARELAADQPAQASADYRRHVDLLVDKADAAPEGPSGRPDRQRAAMAAVEAAGHERHVRRDARAAIDYLRIAARYTDADPEGVGVGLVHWRIAEIERVDRRDAAAAIRELEREIELQRKLSSRHDVMQRLAMEGFVEWLGAEVAFLRTRKVHRGPVSDEIRSAVALLAFFGAGFDPPPALLPIQQGLARGGAGRDAATMAQFLAAMERSPPSALNVVRAMPWLSRFSDEASMRRFLVRHDPAGALTLGVLSLFVGADGQEFCRSTFAPGICDEIANGKAAQDAAVRILASRGQGVRSGPDARLATPEMTWATFVAAMRAGDRKTALACFEGNLRVQRRDQLAAMTPAEMREMVDSFSPAVMGARMGSFQEATVTKTITGESTPEAFFIQFTLQGTEWRISSM